MSEIQRFCVNLSGSVQPVYNDNNRKIGDIMLREFFLVWGNEGNLTSIYFKGPSGTMLNGYLHDAPDGATTPITDRSHSIVRLNGEEYRAFIMRRTMNLRNTSNIVVGSVAAGKRVLCKTGTSCGDSHPEYLAINYAEKRAGGWDKIFDSKHNYGYVETGMSISTSYSGIPLYGNW